VDYYNQRARFVDAFWSVVNWESVEATYKAHVDAVQAAQENKTEL
jgi:superoxide dismutase